MGVAGATAAATPAAAAQSLIVFAAASLADVMPAIESRYEARYPDVDVQVHVAGSALLARQVQAGAPCDVFLSAARDDLEQLRAAGRLGTPRRFAANRLVVCAPRMSPVTASTWKQAARILLANPRTAPLGRYSLQALACGPGPPPPLERRVYAEHARHVVAQVAAGAAEVGIAYRTDVGAVPGLRIVSTFPAHCHDPILYYAAARPRGDTTSAGSTPDAAAAFVAVLASDAVQALLARAGFQAADTDSLDAAPASPPRPPAPGLLAAGSPLRLSLRVAGLATLLVAVVGLALGATLARRRGFGAEALAALTDLPLVLPPTVVGLALLELLRPDHPPGAWLAARGWHLTFTWGSAVLASALMALPLMVRASRAALESVPRRFAEAAATLGAGPWRTFWRIQLPLARRGVAAGVVLAFFRALGEFGATLMVAGNLPGHTQTLPLAIYSASFEGRPHEAWTGVAVVAALSFAGAWLAQRLSGRPAS